VTIETEFLRLVLPFKAQWSWDLTVRSAVWWSFVPMGWQHLVSAWSLWTSICIQPQQKSCHCSSLGCREITDQDEKISSSPVNDLLRDVLPLCSSSVPVCSVVSWCDI